MRWVIWGMCSMAVQAMGAGSAKPLTCKNGDDVRVIRREVSDDKSCEVFYEKKGTVKSVASAKQDADYCDAAVVQIRSTLESAHFKCR